MVAPSASALSLGISGHVRAVFHPQSGAGISRDPPSGLRQLLQQPFRLLPIRRRETFGETIVNGLEERQGISGTALIAQQPGKARGRAEFPGQRALPAGPVEGLPEIFFCRSLCPRGALQNNEFSFDAQQLRDTPSLFAAFRARERLGYRGEPASCLPGPTQRFR